MRSFTCHTCGRPVTFESSECLYCATALACDPAIHDLSVLDRSRGRDVLHPFVLPPAVMDELALVHDMAGRP